MFPGAAHIPEGGLAFATVVFADELPQLRLQARGMARFVPKSDVAEIVICINDLEEAHVEAEVRAMLPEYGPLADRVRIVRPVVLFGGVAARGGWQKLRSWLTRAPMARPARIWSGWKGNFGWSVQQAIKLRLWRVIRARHVVIWDAKNVPVAPLGHADFVAEDGRARAVLKPPKRLHRRWLPASMRAVGLRPGQVGDAEVTHFTTPFCVERRVLRAACGAFETRQGPVEAAFAVRPMNIALWGRFNYSEFMVINAWCFAEHGRPDAVFARGLVRPHALSASSSHSDIAAMLAALDNGGTWILSLHSAALSRLDDEQRALLARHLVARGLVADEAVAKAMFDKIVRSGQARSDRAQKRMARRDLQARIWSKLGWDG